MSLTFKIYLLVLILTLFGGFLRFYKLGQNPPSLTIDEVSFGYSAYSILKTAKDENGNFMPLTFRSTGDYKNPFLIYTLVPSIRLFGLNEFSVRFTTALFGTLTIPLFFFLASLLIDRKVALIGTIFLTISPWHIYLSRLTSETVMGVAILILGVLLFLNIWRGRLWAFSSALILGISLYAYHSLRYFVPILILYLFLYSNKINNQDRTKMFIFFVTGLIATMPLLYMTIFGGANTRAGMVFLSNDIDYTRYVIIDHLYREFQFGTLADFFLKPLTFFSNENFLLFFFWIKRYLNYFQPDFLFFNGLNMTSLGTIGLGVLYLFELPLLLVGIGRLIKEKIKNKWTIIFWILIGIIPASLTNNEQHAGRSFIILPALVMVIAIGVEGFFQWIKRLRNNYFKISILTFYFFLVTFTITQAFLIFAIHFPTQRGEAFMEGTKQSVLYALENKDKFQEVVYDPYRGIEAPYIVNIPYMYILFYSRYDPAEFQKIAKRQGNDLFGFDKFTIRKIDWRVDRERKDTLFIGSPWSLPIQDIKEEEILQRIYLSNGALALLVVSPR